HQLQVQAYAQHAERLRDWRVCESPVAFSPALLELSGLSQLAARRVRSYLESTQTEGMDSYIGLRWRFRRWCGPGIACWPWLIWACCGARSRIALTVARSRFTTCWAIAARSCAPPRTARVRRVRPRTRIGCAASSNRPGWATCWG